MDGDRRIRPPRTSQAPRLTASQPSPRSPSAAPTPQKHGGVLNCGDGGGAAIWNPRLASGVSSTAGNWIPNGVPDATVAMQIDGSIGFDHFATATTEVTVDADLTVNSLWMTAGAVAGEGEAALWLDSDVAFTFGVYDLTLASACDTGVTLGDLSASPTVSPA